MRAREFIIENMDIAAAGGDRSLAAGIEHSLPSVYAIPELPNSDFYRQYRFGVAIAAARSAKERESELESPMTPSSAWGESQIVIGYALDTDVIDDALKTIGLQPSDKKLLSTVNSEEARDVAAQSPVSSFRGYGK